MAVDIRAVPATRTTDHEVTLAWRFEQLKRAGYDFELATELAIADVDLHDATGLVQRGCDPALAARILL
jgi:hypothetical protein